MTLTLPSVIMRCYSSTLKFRQYFCILKHVDHSGQLVSQFIDWTKTNGMSCNPPKRKEFTIRKRGKISDFLVSVRFQSELILSGTVDLLHNPNV